MANAKTPSLKASTRDLSIVSRPARPARPARPSRLSTGRVSARPTIRYRPAAPSLITTAGAARLERRRAGTIVGTVTCLVNSALPGWYE